MSFILFLSILLNDLFPQILELLKIEWLKYKFKNPFSFLKIQWLDKMERKIESFDYGNKLWSYVDRISHLEPLLLIKDNSEFWAIWVLCLLVSHTVSLLQPDKDQTTGICNSVKWVFPISLFLSNSQPQLVA